jgi:hypothetical protein
MSMPWQLRNVKRPYKGKSLQPIVEQLPSVSINELGIPSLYDYKIYTMPNISLRFPQLAGIRFSLSFVEFRHPSLHRGQEGPTQTFLLKHIRTGFGIRHAFICTCGKPVIRLFYFHRNLACRRCCNARYASQTLNKHTRPILQASRIASFLDNKSRLYRRTRERLKKRLGEKLMMAQGQLGTDARGLWE